MRERQRAQPALARVETERDGRAERAPQEVAVGELDRLGGGRRAGGVDHDGGASQLVARRGEAMIRVVSARGERERLLDEHRRTSGDQFSLGRRQPEVDRYRDGSEQQAGMESLSEGEPRRQRDRDTLPGFCATGGQLGRACARAGEQLGVGDGAVARLQRHPSRAARQRHAAAIPRRSSPTG